MHGKLLPTPSVGRGLSGLTGPERESILQRANRFSDSRDTKLQRDAQKGRESRRSSVAFYSKAKPRHPMTQYSCDICGLTFGTTWLDHCPSCGSRSLSYVIDLSLIGMEDAL